MHAEKQCAANHVIYVNKELELKLDLKNIGIFCRISISSKYEHAYKYMPVKVYFMLIENTYDIWHLDNWSTQIS